MKLGKKLLSSTSALALALTVGSTAAFAAPVNTNGEENQEIQDNLEIQPRVSWSGTAYLSEKSWTNITSSNNIFPDSPTVTNSANNSGSITVRIIDEDNKQIGKAYTIEPGKSKVLDQIPAFSGTYTLQGKGEKEGKYTVTIR